MFFRDEISQFLHLNPKSFLFSGIEAIFLIAITFFVYLFIKNTFIKFMYNLMQKSDVPFLKMISRNRVLRNLTFLIPIIVLYSFYNNFLNDSLSDIYEKTFYTIIVIVSMMLTFSILNALMDYYVKNVKVAERIPVKPIFQILKVIVFIIMMVVIFAHFIDKTPVYILSGLGAVSAVILFIFKDTIQSLIAAFQITLHRSVKPGDWIEVPKYSVNGEIVDINLNLISVKNWDNTTTVIPTYCLLTESFKNWTTMFATGRRIKRAINIDVSSIKQLDDKDIQKLKQVKLIKQYLEQKEADISQINTGLATDDELIAINGKRLTNIGTFRKYVEYYLKHHPEILQDQLLIVRQLENLSTGIPIEIYCFTGKTFFNDFESVQSDIFDHLYSIVALFGLHVYQQPSGRDYSNLGNNIKTVIQKLE